MTLAARVQAGTTQVDVHMIEAATTPYWNALSDDEFERYERRQRFIDHFAAVLTHRQAEVLGVVAEQCADHGQCALSIDALAYEAVVSRWTVYGALRAARERGLIEMREGVIRIISAEWQALLREEEGRAERTIDRRLDFGELLAQQRNQGIGGSVALRDRLLAGGAQGREGAVKLGRVDLPSAVVVTDRADLAGPDVPEDGRLVDAAGGGGAGEIVHGRVARCCRRPAARLRQMWLRTRWRGCGARR
jgi:hypothetical protein